MASVEDSGGANTGGANSRRPSGVTSGTNGSASGDKPTDKTKRPSKSAAISADGNGNGGGLDSTTDPADSNPHQEAWLRVRQKLQAKVGSEVFNSWFGRMKMEDVSGGVALHSVPTAFLKSWINSHYRDLICELWQAENNSVLRADVVLRSAVRRDISKPAETRNSSNSADGVSSNETSAKPIAATRANRNLAQPPASDSDIGFSGSPLDTRHTFANFLESKSNRMAYAAARSVAEDDGSSVRFNPLFIHANVGLGKTHLLQAIAWEARQRDPSKKVRYLTADYFMWVFAKALHNQTCLLYTSDAADE